MKKKLLALFSLLSAMTMMAVGAVACGETPDNSENTGSGNVSTDTGSNTEDKTPSLTISQQTLSLEVYASATLTAELKNSESAISWSSSDASVVKVVDGVVTALKAGTATISATAGDLTDSCVVTVTEATEAPVFANLEDSFNLIKGTNMELDVTLTYKGQAFEGATISVTADSEKVSVNESVVTAVEYGETTLTVTASFNGVTMATATVTVNVIEFGTLIVDLPDNQLNVWIGKEGYALSNIIAQINGVNVENPEFTVVSNNEEVVKVVDGKLTAVGAGETTVNISFTTEMATYDTTLTVISQKEQAMKSVNFFVQGDAGKEAAETGNAVIDLSATEIDLSTVSAVLCDGVEVEFSAEGTNLTLINAAGGYKLYTLVTPFVDYVIDGMVYGYSISTAEELLAWREKVTEWKAYTVLMNDIDLGGAQLSEGIYTLVGALDGRGYSISNFIFTETSGFFYYIAEGAAVRNIQFINVVQDCAGQEDKKPIKMGLLGDNLKGTAENLLAKITVINMQENTDHYGVMLHYASKTAVANNIVVYTEAFGCAPHYFYGFAASGEKPAPFHNIRFVCAGTGNAFSGQEATSSGSHVSTAKLVEEAKFESWGGLWQVTDAGIPCMSDYADNEATPFVSAQNEATIGATLSFITTSFYPLTYTLAQEVTGITMQNNQVLISTEASIGTEFAVNVTCDAIPAFAQQLSFTVQKEARTLEGVMLAKGDGTRATITGKAPLDFTDKGVSLANINSVTIDGVAFTDYEVSGSKLILSNAPGGDHVFVIDTATATYTVKACVYTHAITTAEEFDAWRGDASGTPQGYYVLLNDIDMKNAVLSNGNAIGNHVVSTLDGRGYKVSNFTYGAGIVRGMNLGGTVKNIYFDNVTQDCTGLANGHGFFGNYIYNATIENVYLDVTTINLTGEHYGILFRTALNQPSTVKNVVVEITNKENKFSYAYAAGSVAGCVFEGIVGAQCAWKDGEADYNGGAKASEGNGEYAPYTYNGGFAEKIDWMIANDSNKGADSELLLFTSPYWVIDTIARTITLKPW